jgi:transposase
MRFVKLTQEQVNQLEQLYRESGNHRERQRAQALLLSNRGYTMEQLAELFVVDRDTISNWFTSWTQQQTKEEIGLQDAARSGRPSGLSAAEKKR